MDQVEHRWGTPGKPGTAAEARWKTEHLTVIRVANIALLVHRELAAIFTHLCLALAGKGVDLSRVADDWGFANRPIREASAPSFHATGQAIDLNATENPMGVRRTTLPVRFTRRLVAKLGLRWGFDYHGRPDAMHVEFIHPIDEARRITAKLNKPTPAHRVKNGVRKANRRGRANPYGAPHRDLHPGSHGDGVRWAQWALGLRRDGIYGPVTYRTVRAFQTRHGLVVDGVVGPRTRAQLRAVTR